MSGRSHHKPTRARHTTTGGLHSLGRATPEGSGQPHQPPAAAAAFVRRPLPTRAAGRAPAAGAPDGGAPQPTPGQPAAGAAAPNDRVTRSACAAPTGCAAVLAEAQPQGLAVTYWIEPPAWASREPYEVALRFAGERVDGPQAPRDRFTHEEEVGTLTAGHGRVAVTARIPDIGAGTWRVTATARAHPVPASPASGTSATGLPTRVSTAATRFAPLTHGPAVRLAVWPVLVGVAVLVAVSVQGVLHARARHPVPAAVLAALAASLVGYASAKVYYLVLHREPLRNLATAGTCIQGFLLGGIGSLTIAAAGFGLPVGEVLDAAAPAVFFGMAVGRPGCFFSGCCAGRPTASRWGLFSSDRRLAVRRIPIQLLEAAVALLIGAIALLLVLAEHQARGLVFLGAVAAYTLLRQLMFPLRADAHTARGRHLAMAASAAVLLTALVLPVAR